MSTMVKICPKWYDFESNIRESFKELRENQNYFDVTIATEDGHTFEAHKIILSAGSQFFSNILKQINHPSPFIYLKGMDKIELEHVLNFLYNGEVLMAQDELNSFLETAKELQVKGLQSNQEDKSYQKEQMEVKSTVPLNSNKEVETFRNESVDQGESVLEMSNSFATSDNTIVKIEDEEDPLLFTNLLLDHQIEQMIEKHDGQWRCKVCGKISRQKADIKKHSETHIEGVTHSCHICSKTTSTRHSLQVHILNYHSGLCYTCPVCNKPDMTKIAFKIHKRRCKASK